jgi:hypothetical protein
MVENPDPSDISLAAYLNVRRLCIEEALAEGLTPDQARQQTRKLVQPPTNNASPQEEPLKKAA